jgi:hypothetical protein
VPKEALLLPRLEEAIAEIQSIFYHAKFTDVKYNEMITVVSQLWLKGLIDWLVNLLSFTEWLSKKGT